DGTTSATLTLNAGTYTPADLAKEIARVINNDQAISAGGSKVAVQYDSTTQAFTINSDKYGSGSSVGLLSGNFLTSGVSGLGVTAATSGTDVQGYLEQGGTLYTFVGTGQDVTINSFLPGAPKGLSLSIGGTQTGARGTVDFNRGYADKLNQLFDQMTNTDTGIVGTRMKNIQSRLDNITEQKTKIDERYNRLEQKYLMQFSALQSLLAQMDNTKQSLAASLGMNTNSGN
ncbi:MAG: flagellar filament capping protein FliD, partial [Hydrogenovibrio sp.]|nr:flagellar filament capping protein FliD [Hydrogenovibrio sp.]